MDMVVGHLEVPGTADGDGLVRRLASHGLVRYPDGGFMGPDHFTMQHLYMIGIPDANARVERPVGLATDQMNMF